MFSRCLSTLLALTACAHVSKDPCPEKGGTFWVEASSEHFVVRSDLDAEDAIAIARELETSWAALAHLAFRSDDPPRMRVTAIVFRSRAKLEALTHGRQMAGFMTRDDLGRPVIVLQGAITEASREILQHELTHVFVGHYLPRAPRWLNEGLARFWSTLRVRDDHASFGEPVSCAALGLDKLGACHPSVWDIGLLPSIDELVTASAETFYERSRAPAYYAGAWALVHVLSSGTEIPTERFSAYQAALAHGEDRRGSWAELVRDADLASLESRYRDYFSSARIPSWRAAYVPKRDAEVHVRSLSAAETHLVRARWSPKTTDEERGHVRSELEEALAHEPSHAEAHFELARLAKTSSDARSFDEHLSRAIDLAPAEPRYLLARLIALTERDPSQPEVELVVKRLAPIARGASALNAIAWSLALRGRTLEGLPFAMRALDAEPGCWECLDTLAVLRDQQGKTSEALELERRAIGLIPDFRQPPREMIERLRKYEQAAR
jgi:tetratricopeptide (TPR) repeat protein